MLTTNQAALAAHVARVTILKWITRGRLPATKFGTAWMIDERDLETTAATQRERRKGGRPRKSAK